MKKIPHFLLILFGIAAVFLLTVIFLAIYVAIGSESSQWAQNTLFSLLQSIDYTTAFLFLCVTFVYMFALDSIILIILIVWRKSRDKNARNIEKGRFYRYWFNYRKIHLTFILLTIFLTIAISAPATVMNTFTAIVSISVLVSNLTKKIGNDD